MTESTESETIQILRRLVEQPMTVYYTGEPCVVILKKDWDEMLKIMESDIWKGLDGSKIFKSPDEVKSSS